MKLVYEIKKIRKKLTLSKIRFIDANGNERELTYWLHDYGKLAYWLYKYGNIDEHSEWLKLQSIFILDEAFGNIPSNKRKKWYKWHIKKLQEIGATKKIDKNKYRLGKLGKLMFEAAQKSLNWSNSLENLLIGYLVARRMENLGLLLKTVSQKGISVICSKKPKGLQRPKDLKISWNDLLTNLKDVFFIHTEIPSLIPHHRSPNNTLILSGILFNEIYMLISNIRRQIIEKISRLGETVDPYILADRGAYEIKRALERLNILQRRWGMRFTSLPDSILISIVNYSFLKLKSESISQNDFIKILKDDFRFLVHPTDVIKFLSNSVMYRNLGINLDILKNDLEQNYSDFLERLVSLGYATIRPDGEARIESPEIM